MDCAKAPLTEGSVPLRLLRLCLPLIFANLFQTLYQLADMLMVAWYVGREAVSAVAVGGQVVYFLTTFSLGLAAGGQILLAQYRGAGDGENQRELMGTLATVSLLAGLAAALFGVLFCRPVLTWMQTPERAFDQAVSYMGLTSAGLIFVFGYQGICGIYRGLGHAKPPFYLGAVSAALNIGLNYLFVVRLGLGVRGTALGTVLAQGAAYFAAVFFLWVGRRETGISFSAEALRPRAALLWQMFKVGIPFGLQLSAIYLANLFITALVNRHGLDASAVLGIGTRVTGLCIIPMMAIGNGATTMVGQNMGAGETERAGRAVRWALVYTLILSAATLLLSQRFPEEMFALFGGDASLTELGVRYLRIVSWSYFGYALHSAYNGMVLGIGFSLYSLMAAVVEAVLGRVLLPWLLGASLGLEGIFLAQAIAPYCSGIIAAVYFHSGKWRTRPLKQ